MVSFCPGHGGPHDASMFYCGDDEEAKEAVCKLIEAVGFEPVDCGPLDSARMLEPMAALIIRLGYNLGMGNEIAFKLLPNCLFIQPIRMPPDHVNGRHDHARCAEPALQSMILPEGFLHRV